MAKKISYNFKTKFRTVLFITIGWMVVGALNVYYNHMMIMAQQSFEFSDYDLETTLITNAMALFVAGLAGGSLIIFFLKEKLGKKPLYMVILINMSSFIIIIMLVTILAFLFYNWLFIGESYFNSNLWFNFVEFISSYSFILNLIVWTLVATATMVILQISDRYGRGVFLETLLGKYHTPIIEQRIFMFLDLKSSTTIAEQLGHKRYFKFINRFFEDVTTGVVEYKGDIYQYVGDEIIITWPLKEGLENANCLNCFFEIRRIINLKSHIYLRKFKVIPDFKAAVHGGEVTTGQVGTFKKDIIFSGDVLNTTSRIEEMCRLFDVSLLVSEFLVTKISLNSTHLALEEMGNADLRGKQHPVKVYSVTMGLQMKETIESERKT